MLQFEMLEGRALFSGSVVEPATPAVLDARLDYSHAPHAIEIQFNSDVCAELDAGDLRLFHESGRFLIPAEAIDVVWNDAWHTARLEFSRLDVFDGVLPEGRWFAILRADGITNAEGKPLAEDYQFEFAFHRGDANGDGKVNADDVRILVDHFGMTDATFNDGDFNYDGVVNVEDWNIMASRLEDQSGTTALASVATEGTLAERRPAWSATTREESIDPQLLSKLSA